jgi:putative transposase
MIFETSRMKDMFLEVIRKAKLRYQFSIYNFCIMGNHFHIIIQPHKGQNLSSIMQWILSVFAKRFNQYHGINGHVWYDRFRSKVIQSLNQYLHTFFYISWNPVKAGITSNPFEYRYNGISFMQKGILDILERPPNGILTSIWKYIYKRT